MDEGGTMLATGIYCRGCGYDLRGSAQRCPECGRAFDRANRKTFYRSRRSLRVRWWGRRILLLLLLVTLLPALGLTWLAWGWWDEQKQLIVLRKAEWSVCALKPLYPWVPKCLPAEWACLADRVDHLRAGRSIKHDLQRLTRLKRLRVLESGYFRNDQLQTIGQLARLEHLEVHGRAITDEGLAHLAGLSRMHTLVLQGTGVTGTGLKHLKAMPHLEALDLQDTLVDDKGAAFLGELRGLKHLNLSRVPYGERRGDVGLITDAGMKHLAGLTQIRILNLSETGISDGGLRHLKGMMDLEELVLSSTAITDAGLEHLKALRSLKFLSLDTGVTPAGLQGLRVALPQLHIRREVPRHYRHLRMALVNIKSLCSDMPDPVVNQANIASNLKRHLYFIDLAADHGADFIGFPELSINGYRFSQNMSWLRLDGPEVTTLAQKAFNRGLYISAGLAEQDMAGKRWNTQIVIGPGGRIVGQHRKRWLTKEEGFVETGTDHSVFNVKGLRMGIVTCADGTDQKHLRALVANGAQVIYGPHANTTGGTTAGWYRFRSAWGGPDGWIAQLKVHAALHNHAGLYHPDFHPPTANDGHTGWSSGAWFIGPDGLTLAQMPASTLREDSKEFLLIHSIPMPAEP